MKLNLSFLTGTASLAMLISGAFADSAVTDPVGYVTVNMATTNNSETFIGASLYNKVEFAGTVTAVSGTTITVGGAPFTVGQFDATYFVEITNGAGEGVWTDIATTPTTGTFTTNDNLASLITANTTTIKIRKHHTVESFFGDPAVAGDQNKAGFQAGPQISQADNLVIFDASTQTPVVIFFSTDEFDGGWRTSAGVSKSDMIIAPGQGIKVVRAPVTTGAASFVQVGHVKTGKTVFAVESGENYISIPSAVGVTLDGSGLGTTITAGPQISAADNVVVNTANNAFKALFFSTDEFDGGWRDAGAVSFGSQLLKEGTSVGILNSVNTAAFNWTIPATTIAP